MNGQYHLGDIVLGDWILVRQLGEGSFGKVYEAEREDFGNTYKSAIKIITVPKSESEIKSAYADGLDDKSVTTYFRGIVEELVQEFALMSKLKGNSNVVSYEDHRVIKHQSGIGWDIIIRMELLTPLLDHIQNNKMTRRDVIKLGVDICKALEICQRYNIVHRDIKPENVFISELGDYKLGDFGIARTVEKTTGGLSKKGTYNYMAPEVYKGEPYNSSVDIYSLGIVMFWLLNENRTPFLPAYPTPITYSDREVSLTKRMAGTPIPMPGNADGRLAEIVLKACAYRPRDRYSSPMQMKGELEAIQYQRAEGPMIYPNGDQVAIQQTGSVSSGNADADPGEGTVNIFGPQPGAARGEAKGIPTERDWPEKTEGIFTSRRKEERSEPLTQQSDEDENRIVSVDHDRKDDHDADTGRNTNRHSRLPIVISVALAMIVIIAAILAVPKLRDNGSRNDEKTDIKADDVTPKPVQTTPTSRPTPAPTPVPFETPAPEPTITPTQEPVPVHFTDYTGSIRGYAVVPFTAASASSELFVTGWTYYVENVIDGDLKTSWQDGVEGDGIGESLTLYFGEVEEIDMLCLRLGYVPYYETNGRPSKIEFEFSDGTVLQHSFVDENRDLYIKLSEPISTFFVKLTILAVYQGTEWDDTCITEVTAYRAAEA